jgi:thiamine-phosphate pyrophosphorylase
MTYIFHVFPAMPNAGRNLFYKYKVMDKRTGIFRIIDANLNRLREALRVIEEYYRFIDDRPVVCIKLKKVRHSLIEVENAVGKERLLAGRDTTTDCFAGRNRPEECERDGIGSVLSANFKRGQEASRVLEEYAKIEGGTLLSARAKAARFVLYTLEKELSGGKEKKGKRRGRGFPSAKTL